jgi:hypothetical protein
MGEETPKDPSLGEEPREGAKRILEGIERIHWTTTSCLCFVGSALACLRYLGEDLTNDYLMGVSGGAFKMFWGPPWDAGNCDLLMIGQEPIRRTFDALGYQHELVLAWDCPTPQEVKKRLRPVIVEQIDRGRPLIAIGVVGPPEACILAGYDRAGDVLYGRSYFQSDEFDTENYRLDETGYFITDQWSDNCYGVIVLGEKQAPPSPSQVLQDTLEWAITLIRVPEHQDTPAPGRRLLSGLAAYDAMAEALERDEEWPADDLATLTFHGGMVVGNDGIHLLRCERACAARFLAARAEEGLPGAEPLGQAAEIYNQEVQILDRAAKMTPYTSSPPPDRLRMADPAHRRELAGLMGEARAHEESAVGHLERALQELTERPR